MKLRYSFFAVCTLVFLSSCKTLFRSKRNMEVNRTEEHLSVKNLLNRNQSNQFGQDVASSSGVLAFSYKSNSQKDFAQDSRFSYVIIPGEGFRLVLTPFPFVEAGRLWVNQDEITLLNRLGKNYTSISEANMKSMTKGLLSYETLDCIFRGQIFVPGLKTINPEIFSLLKKQDKYVLQTESPDYALTYVVLPNGLIESERLLNKDNSRMGIDVNYEGYEQINNAYLPTKMQIAIHAGKELLLDFTFKSYKLDNYSADILRPNISNRYSYISLENLLKSISKF